MDRERVEMRGRRAIGFGFVVAMTFTSLACVASLLPQYIVNESGPAPRSALFWIAWAIAAASLFGFAMIGYGLVQMIRSRPRRSTA